MTARRALHEHAIALHDALDVLEANDALRDLDWLLEGTDALLQLAVGRLEQIRYCLKIYGHTTQPPPIPLHGGDPLRGVDHHRRELREVAR